MADAIHRATGARIAASLARKRVPLGFLSGAAILWLAHPTFSTLAAGSVVAAAGEAMRIWAAGHLEKASEVTRSGPYRITRHPLYLGSTLIGAGIAIAAARWTVALLIALYLCTTIVAAIRHEEGNMRADFGERYDAYVAAQGTAVERSFSFERALRNREQRAIAGLMAAAAVFALKAWRHL